MRIFAVIFVATICWWTAKANEPSAPVNMPSATDSFASAKSTYVMCKINGNVRTVRVVVDQHECKTTYTKEGLDEIVASGKNRGTCFGVLGKIKANLEKANWFCRDISTAVVSEANNGAN